MKDKDKTKAQLIEEMEAPRNEITVLKDSSVPIHSAFVGLYKTNLKGDFFYVNKALSDIFEFESPEEMMAESAVKRYRDPKDREALIEALRKEGRVNNFEVDLLTKTGKVKHVIFNAVFSGDCLSGMLVDITERKQAEEARKKIETQYHTLAENSQDYIMRYDREYRHTYANAACLAVAGKTAEGFIGRTHREIGFPDDMCDLWEFAIEKVFIIGKPHGEVFKFAGVHGEVVLDWRLFPEMDAQGRVNSVLGVSRDITKLKKAEESLRETNEYLENLFDYANAPIIVWDPQFKITRFNHAFEYLTGYKEKDVIGQRLNILFPDESEEESLDKIERTLAGEFWESVEIPILRKDGIVRIALWNSANVLDRDNKTVLATIAQGIDITERKQAEEALHHSEVGFRRLSQEFNAILNTIPDSLTLLSSDLKVLWTNQGAASALGKDISEIVGQPCYKVWFNRSTPCLAETCPSVRSFHSGNPDGGNVSTPDGRLWDTRTFPIRGDDCKVFSVIKLDRDITEHRKLEEQLRQSQKMQAIGTLAGGVAHDFNNILTAVIGYAHVIQMKTKEGEPVRHYAEQILAASERAANLTQSLLAFGRKALMNPRPVNLNEIVRKVEKLLRRIIGEDIELKSILTAEELTIFADSGQIEQVIMNLAVNARDAMPHGGQLTINTSVITLNDEFIKEHGYGEAGKYAAFSVTDTGEGMDDSVREKIFEPFFTTKEVGKGTGLGLSMVYGIIKRHDGYINVYSMPKRGTTFLIYLPLIEAKAEAIERPAEPAPILRRSTETVLIAEDDGAARKYMADVLKQDGYKVIEAVDGKDAVNKFMDNKDKVQALLLDVVLPKKNGREVYEEISKINPGIKVLYMSGYTADIIHKHGIIDNGLNFISKPVSPTKLLKKMRELLDRTTS